MLCKAYSSQATLCHTFCSCSQPCTRASSPLHRYHGDYGVAARGLSYRLKAPKCNDVC